MKLMVIDGNSIINRAFYGIRALNAPDGTPTNAVYGFIRILQKLLTDENPDAAVVAFDRPEPTFRHEMSGEYKATRHGMPDELAEQMPITKDVLDAMRVVRAECAGWEADDILGTAARSAVESGWESVIVTGDRDSLQLVGDASRVLLIKTRMGQTETIDYTTERFFEEYGFEPGLLIDLKALMGDTSDNIPGVRGVGEKTALDLVRRFGAIENIYEKLDELDIRDAVRNKLRDGRESAELSKTLATIRTDAPVDISAEAARLSEPDAARLYEIYSRLGFTKLLEKLNFEKPAATEPEDDFVIPAELDVSRIGCNIKDRIRVGDTTDWLFDVSLAAYLISPTDKSYELDVLTQKYLGRELGESETAAKSALAQLYLLLDAKLREDGMDRLYYDVELPLCAVLADMERAGVCVDREELADFGQMLEKRIDVAEARVYEFAGEEFNIASPKQLGVILFEKLMLPPPKKTKTGYSTAADVLDKLAPLHPIIAEVKSYRELTKLKATYADGLMRVLDIDSRIRTSFQMTVTATGRLSSTEPNLQNIPIRRELGGELRRMFVAPPGFLLVDADYSQIELRILAHIAHDEAMLEAFRSGEDIHTVTAARVFNVPLEEVTPLLRMRAKAVNFGIVYGISPFSLSEDIGVSMSEAKEYIDSYLERFSGVRTYMTDIVERAKADGYVTTLFGRRRAIPELKSSNFNMRSFGERVALNTPIQGTAADIMKIAMVNVARALKADAPQSRLILQVHDELIVEAPEADAAHVAEILRREMENAATLEIPLTVEAHVGRSWHDAK